MRFKGDISGLDELQERIDDAYFSVLSEVGRNATRNAKNQKTFQNRTGNLANANGGCVVRNGQIVGYVGGNGRLPSRCSEENREFAYLF